MVHPGAAAHAAALESPIAGHRAPHFHRRLRAREDGAFILANAGVGREASRRRRATVRRNKVLPQPLRRIAHCLRSLHRVRAQK
jgi:hypothetical protein